MNVLCVVNQKGGVGKTTTAVNLAAGFGLSKKKALLIDLDPQGNATTGSGIDASESTITKAILNKTPLSDVIVKTEYLYHLAPSNETLTEAEVYLTVNTDLNHILQEKMYEVQDMFDVVIIDCPPSLNSLTLSAFIASSGVIVPVQCEYYALEGISKLMNTLAKLRENGIALRVHGILRTLYDQRNTLCREVSSEIVNHFSDTVYETIIPKNVALAESPGFGKPIMYHAKYSKGSIAYLSLVAEIIKRGLV